MYSHHNGQAVSYETWMAALASSACIGFTSLVPWLFNMTFFERHKVQPGIQEEDGRMRFLLSFAVGAMLGDIFFHLIPESFQSHQIEFHDPEETAYRKVGASILAGLFMFIIVEMVLVKFSQPADDVKVSVVADIKIQTTQQREVANSDNQIPLFISKDLKQSIGAIVNNGTSLGTLENNNNIMTDLNFSILNNYNCNHDTKADFANNNLPDVPVGQENLKFRKKGSKDLPSDSDRNGLDNRNSSNDKSVEKSGCKIIDVAGYLNLIANGFDNFTHGLAIGASFLVGPKVGLLTTFVIFIHEIPHEICDYAILVNAGFSRWDAVKAQSSVSLFGILGTAVALYVKSVQTLNAKTIWILPFSAGGFLYIALVNILPEILDRKSNLQNSFGQVTCVILGIALMAVIAVI